MVWLRVVLTLMMKNATNITEHLKLQLDPANCPSFVEATHQLCTSKSCDNTVSIHTPRFKVKHEVCAAKDVFCMTPECLNAASDIIKNMDTSAEPCHDFYNFACGSFEKTTRIPEDKQLVNIFTFFEDNLRDQIMSVLTSNVEHNGPIRSRIPKHFYELCNRTSKIVPNSDEHHKIIEKFVTLGKNFGGFPLLDSTWKPMNWRDITSNVFKKGFSANYFVGMDLERVQSFSGVSNTVLKLGYPNFLLSPDILVLGLNDERVKTYLRFMNKVILTFGAKQNLAQLDVGEILAFEIMLASMTVSSAQAKQGYFTFSSLYDEKFKWVDYVNKILGPEVGTFQEKSTVFVEDMHYLDQIQTTLETNTKSKTLQNYVMWRVMLEVLPYLPPIFSEQLTLYESTIINRKLPRLTTEEKCAKMALLSLPELVGALYVDKYVKETTAQDVRKMIDTIKESYSEAVAKLTWMEETDRSFAKKLAKDMRPYIAYPIIRLKKTEFEDLYKNLQINEASFFELGMNILKKRNQQKFKEYLFQSGEIWDLHKAFYIPQVKHIEYDNSIDVTATILQDEVYTPNRPDFMNYASLGIIIAHEIAHHHHIKSWTPLTIDQYSNRTKCFVEQYSNLMVPKVGGKLNGEQTVTNNVEDQASMKIAYKAYEKWLKANGHDKTLPGLELFSDKQMFWLSAARSFCEVYRHEELAPLVYFGDVAPARYRVNTAFSNLQEFITDFKCPLGSNMNPVNKCQMW